MLRIHDKNINTPEWYDKIYPAKIKRYPYFDLGRIVPLTEKVKPEDKVADLGAGVYGAGQYVAENPDLRAEVWAYDYCDTARRETLDRMRDTSRITYIVADVTDIGTALYIEPETFDVVIVGEVLEHVEDPYGLLYLALAITKPGGYLSISMLNPDSPGAVKHGEYPEHLYRFEVEEIVDFLERYGVVEVKTAGNNFIFHARKYE